MIIANNDPKLEYVCDYTFESQVDWLTGVGFRILKSTGLTLSMQCKADRSLKLHIYTSIHNTTVLKNKIK